PVVAVVEQVDPPQVLLAVPPLFDQQLRRGGCLAIHVPGRIAARVRRLTGDVRVGRKSAVGTVPCNEGHRGRTRRFLPPRRRRHFGETPGPCSGGQGYASTNYVGSRRLRRV